MLQRRRGAGVSFKSQHVLCMRCGGGSAAATHSVMCVEMCGVWGGGGGEAGGSVLASFSESGATGVVKCVCRLGGGGMGKGSCAWQLRAAVRFIVACQTMLNGEVGKGPRHLLQVVCTPSFTAVPVGL